MRDPNLLLVIALLVYALWAIWRNRPGRQRSE
jgi:hypothetical protein